MVIFLAYMPILFNYSQLSQFYVTLFCRTPPQRPWLSLVAGYVVCIMLPRRLAAVTVAQRVSQEMGVELGREVGYRIRCLAGSHGPQDGPYRFCWDVGTLWLC